MDGGAAAVCWGRECNHRVGDWPLLLGLCGAQQELLRRCSTAPAGRTGEGPGATGVPDSSDLGFVLTQRRAAAAVLLLLLSCGPAWLTALLLLPLGLLC